MPTGIYPRTKPPWNKGLTKETDERLLKESIMKKEQYIKGELKGVFKKGHSVPKEWRDNLSKLFKGKHHSPKTGFKKGQKMLKAWSIKSGKTRTERFKSGELFRKATKGSFKKGHKMLPGSEKGWFKKGHKESRELRERRLRNSMKGNFIKPNKPEIILKQLIDQNNLPFNYVGDGNIIIEGFNPDFLSKNPKYIIEVFGDYWHNKPNVKERDERRFKAYKKYGYKTLIIWEHEFKNLNAVLLKITNFISRKGQKILKPVR